MSNRGGKFGPVGRRLPPRGRPRTPKPHDGPLSLIKQERYRQVKVEGWRSDHDDRYVDGELMRAAISYLWFGTKREPAIRPDGAPMSWPWEPEWWKPRDRLRNLVRAGALIIAERDRLHRAGISNVAHVNGKLMIVVRELRGVIADGG